jgi:hypothetical protein
MALVARDNEISASSNSRSDNVIIGGIMFDDAWHAGGFNDGHHAEVRFDQLLDCLIDGKKNLAFRGRFKMMPSSANNRGLEKSLIDSRLRTISINSKGAPRQRSAENTKLLSKTMRTRLLSIAWPCVDQGRQALL